MSQGDTTTAGARVPGAHDAAVGRPRDPLVEPRALSAALDVYGSPGWSGFTMGRVTALSRVGKSSIYRRWPGREELLAAAFDRVAVLFELDDRQLRRLPFVERLLTMTQHRLYTYSTPTGPAIIRLQVEHHAEPDTVGKIWNRTIPQSLVGLQRLLAEGRERQLLRPEASPKYLADALEGSMVMHALGVHSPTDASGSNLEAQAYAIVSQVLGLWLTQDGSQLRPEMVPIAPLIDTRRAPLPEE